MLALSIGWDSHVHDKPMAWLDQNAMTAETLLTESAKAQYILMLTTMPPHGSAVFAPVSAQICDQSLVLDVAVLQLLQKLWPQLAASSLQSQRHIPLLPADRPRLQHIGGQYVYGIAVTLYEFAMSSIVC